MSKHSVILNNVQKKYVLNYGKPTFVGKIFLKGGHEDFWALKGVNLKIKKGDKVGVIGPNGSGKTTLLELIAGISHPTKGSIYAKGKIVSLINLNAGFQPELGGIDNVFISAYLVGMVKSEIQKNLESIINFADIGDFINAPLYTYSEGMKLRLGFSIAVHTEPDIILLDEGISVGDRDFINKAENKLMKMLNKDTTLIVASHSMEFVKKHCNRVVWLENGKLYKTGKTKKLVREYLKI